MIHRDVTSVRTESEQDAFLHPRVDTPPVGSPASGSARRTEPWPSASRSERTPPRAVRASALSPDRTDRRFEFGGGHGPRFRYGLQADIDEVWRIFALLASDCGTMGTIHRFAQPAWPRRFDGDGVGLDEFTSISAAARGARRAAAKSPASAAFTIWPYGLARGLEATEITPRPRSHQRNASASSPHSTVKSSGTARHTSHICCMFPEPP